MIKKPTRLIICDDYGLHTAINRAVDQLALEGKIQGVSVLIDLVESDQVETLRKLNRQGELQIGLHWNLTEPLKLRGLEKSFREQTLKFKNIFQKEPDYFDSHHHVHQVPGLGSILLNLMKTEKLKHSWVRNTSMSPEFFEQVYPRLSWKTRQKCFILNYIGERFKKNALRNGFETNESMIGAYDFSRIEDFETQFKYFSKKQKTEFEILMTHPAFDQISVQDKVPRQKEFEILNVSD